MPSSRQTRTEQGQETRQRILQAARALFAERGYHGTTIQDIAAQAGVALRTVYYHFESKAAIAAALAAMVRPEVNALALDLLQTATTPEATLQQVVAALFARYERLATVLWLAYRLESESPELGALLQGPRAWLYQFAEDWLHGLLLTYRQAPPLTLSVLVDLVYTALSFATWRTLTQERGLSSAEAAQAVGTFVIRGVLGRPLEMVGPAPA